MEASKTTDELLSMALGALEVIGYADQIPGHANYCTKAGMAELARRTYAEIELECLKRLDAQAVVLTFRHGPEAARPEGSR